MDDTMEQMQQAFNLLLKEIGEAAGKTGQALERSQRKAMKRATACAEMLALYLETKEAK